MDELARLAADPARRHGVAVTLAASGHLLFVREDGGVRVARMAAGEPAG